jgi:hypothetical protein
MFAFLGLCFITTAMVFGYVASANCWEPVRCAIEVMSRVVFKRIGNDSTMHQEYLDMLEYDEVPPKGTKFTKAKPCSINKGCVDETGQEKRFGARINVDDSLLCAPWSLMKQLQ